MFSWLQSFNHNKMVSEHKKFWEPTMETRQEATEDHLRKVEKDISDLGFAYSTLSGKIDSSYKTLKNMCYKQDRMEELMQEMNSKYESIVAMLARLDVIQTEQGNKQIEGYSSGTVVGSGDVGNRNHNNERGYGEERAYTKLPKIEFPIFGGDNPREWVRNANKYFQLHQILDDLKMGIVEMYLTGKAYVWFHGFLSSHSNADWGLLSTEVCRRFDLVSEEEEEEAVEEVLAEEEHISLDALRGSMNHKTIKIPGKVRGKNISILIDSWSIHSVIDDNLVQTLGYQNGNNRSLTVTMANGQRLESGSIYPPLIWQMQGMEYQYKFRSLKLGGSDMVLGIDWLSQFGPITFDFIQGHISFVNEGIEVILTSEFEMITGPQMNSLMVQQAYGIIGQLCALTEQEVMNSYEGDSMATEKIQSLIIDPTSDQEYKYYNGVLRYKCKSHTMFGCTKQPGIIYRSLRKILGKEKGVGGEKIGVGRFVQVTVSEIYNEKIYDLLPSANIGGRFGLGWSKAGSASKVKLEMMGKKLKNASFISGNEAGKLLKEIKKVEKRRIVKSTLYNERSSRSHCMIILDVPTVGGRFMLVDMAGSENIEQAGQNGMEAKMQTTKINQGNIALKRVVESIANGDSHVPFRDSKLTMLLQDSFEDNKSKILMILCAGPGLKELHKIIAIYGAKAKCIVCGPYTPIKEKGVEDSSSAVILGSRTEAMDQLIYMMQMERKLNEKERNEAQKELRKKEEEISGLRTKLALVDGRGTGISENEIDSKVNDQTQMLKSELERTENVSLSANIEENSFIKRLLQVGSEDSDQIFKDYHDFKPWGQGLFKSGGCYESEPTAEERTLAAAEEEEEQWTAAELRKKTVATEI